MLSAYVSSYSKGMVRNTYLISEADVGRVYWKDLVSSSENINFSQFDHLKEIFMDEDIENIMNFAFKTEAVVR